MTDEKTAERVGALVEERRSAVLRGREDLVAQIDDQLRRLGHEGAPPAKRATRRKVVN